jgi:hypothetical protein
VRCGNCDKKFAQEQSFLWVLQLSTDAQNAFSFLILILPEGRAGEVWKHTNKCSFGYWGALGTKVLKIVFIHQRVNQMQNVGRCTGSLHCINLAIARRIQHLRIDNTAARYGEHK